MSATETGKSRPSAVQPVPIPATKAFQSVPATVGGVSARQRGGITLGIGGGGQLAKMTAQSAAQLGCKVVILERQPEFPAGSVAARTLIGDWNNPDSLLELAAMVDVVTLENEFVDAGALAVLEESGHTLWPSAATLRLAQDKLQLRVLESISGLALKSCAKIRTLVA